MTASIWFDDLPVLGKLPPAEAAAKLREVDENLTWVPSTYLSMEYMYEITRETLRIL